jgi:hypothetical protein
MRIHRWALIVVVSAAPGLAMAQQTPARPEVSPELRQTCRVAVLTICKPSLIPDRAAIRRCAEDNKDKLPPQCSAFITAQKQP